MKTPRTQHPHNPLGDLWPFRKRRRGGTTAAARRRRLRGLVGKALNRRDAPTFSPGRIAIGAGTAFLLSLLLCIHLLPNRVTLRKGDVADRDIVAPRTVRFEDTEATRRERDEAARQVDKRYDVIAGAKAAATDTVRITFDQVEDAVRQQQERQRLIAGPPPQGAPTAAQPPASARAREVAQAIRRESGAFVAIEDVAVLLGQEARTRALARDVAAQVVEKAMDRSITEDTADLAEARREVARSEALERLTNADLRRAVASLAGDALVANRRVDVKETQKQVQTAEAAVPPRMVRLTAGATVIRQGERVTQQHLDAFAALGLQNAHMDAATVAVIILLVCGLVGLTAAYLRQYHRDLYDDTARLLLLSVLTVVSVVGLKIGSALLGVSVPGVPFVYLGMMCVASAGMVIALLISPRVATLIVALLSVASGLILNNELRYTLITLGSSLVGIVSVTTLKNRNDLLRSTVAVCAANAVLNVLVGQLQGDLPREMLLGLLWGVVSGVFAVALFYFGVAAFEKPFGITTHLRLLELSDPATPVLQEFRMRVPGTYAHSLMVSNLAHAAAEAIGADALLVRVAAYYHDLGKMNRPEFFIENQSNAENVHDRLSPSLSAIILASHVKEGLEMAEEIGLPLRVREVIQQHHGTTLMKYFYHRATGGMHDPMLEAQFRYAGPKPQTKEAAILMLADSVEAASRTLSRPTPQRIADFVSKLIEDKRADGQLDECDLTLRDIKAIHDVFTRTLSGALHARIEYPGQAEKPAPAPAAPAEPLADTLPALTLSLSGVPMPSPLPPPGPCLSLIPGEDPPPPAEGKHEPGDSQPAGPEPAAAGARGGGRPKAARGRR